MFNNPSKVARTKERVLTEKHNVKQVILQFFRPYRKFDHRGHTEKESDWSGLLHSVYG